MLHERRNQYDLLKEYIYLLPTYLKGQAELAFERVKYLLYI